MKQHKTQYRQLFFKFISSFWKEDSAVLLDFYQASFT